MPSIEAAIDLLPQIIATTLPTYISPITTARKRIPIIMSTADIPDYEIAFLIKARFASAIGFQAVDHEGNPLRSSKQGKRRGNHIQTWYIDMDRMRTNTKPTFPGATHLVRRAYDPLQREFPFFPGDIIIFSAPWTKDINPN